jgi:hypothetical protein
MLRPLSLAIGLAVLPLCRIAAQGVCDTSKKDRIATTVTPSAQAIPTPLAADFNAGASATVTYSVTVSPTKQTIWYLCLTGVSTNAGTVNGYTKPLSDFEFSVNGTSWTPLSTTSTQVRTGVGTLVVSVLVRARVAYALDQPLSVSTPGAYGPVAFEFLALF